MRKSYRIVIVFLEAPLPFGNAAARWYYVLLKGLVDRGHRVTAFAACSKPSEIEEAKILFPTPSYDLRCYLSQSKRPLTGKWHTLCRPYSYMFSNHLRRDFEKVMDERADIVHLEQLWCGWMGTDESSKALLNIHHLCWIDLENTRPPTMRERITKSLMLRTEKRLVRSFRYIRACSPRLVPEVHKQNPNADVRVIPVALDLTHYRYIKDEDRPLTPTLSIIGNMSWNPTYSAAVRLLSRLWPSIQALVPETKVQIVGWDAKRKLAAFSGMPSVAIDENVPDTRPYFENSTILIYAPDRGSGMKIKILEAMAYGIPVVTTSEGVEGIPAIDGVHVGCSDDDEGLIKRAVALLRDSNLQNRQRLEARKLVESHCSPAPALDALEAIYEFMVSKGNE